MDYAGFLHHGDCVEVMRTMADASVDSVVTDPPYELTSACPGGRSSATEGKVMKGFMGMAWDGSGIAYSVEMWREALRVLKPGGHLLAFSGSRTYHRMVCAVEDAGFEVRDQIMWVYGSGFPKSRNLDGEWEGWGTALKPAHEPIVVARKPLIGTVAANVMVHGTGALNIDGCRIGGESTERQTFQVMSSKGAPGDSYANQQHQYADRDAGYPTGSSLGRWPANLIHDGSDEVLALFPESSSGAKPTRRGGLGFHGANGQDECDAPREAETGSSARFFYCAKATREDRHEGLRMPGPQFKRGSTLRDAENLGADRKGNHHPTVKPTDLMQYLCRLVTPPGGLVLDPFMGSGSTGKAAVLEGFRFVGIDLSPEYVEIARARIAAAVRMGHQPSLNLEAA